MSCENIQTNVGNWFSVYVDIYNMHIRCFLFFFVTFWQAGVKRTTNLHDDRARVDRTAGDTWRRPRGGFFFISAGQVAQAG